MTQNINQADGGSGNSAMAASLFAQVPSTHLWNLVFDDTVHRPPINNWDDFGQSLAQSNGYVSMAWHTTVYDPQAANLQVGMAGLVCSTGTGFPCSVAAKISSAVWLQNDPTRFNDWGDYEGMAGNPSDGSFLTAWGDNRQSSTSTRIWAARLVPQ